MCGTFTTVIDGRVLSELLVKEESRRKRKREIAFLDAGNLPEVQETLFPGSTGWILDGKSEEWQLRKASWGLLPDWAKDKDFARKTFNARWESLAEKPAFRDAFKQERCVVPAKAWFEFRGPSKNREQIRYNSPDGALFAMAGLRHRWNGLETFTVITVPASTPVDMDHDRMPLLLEWDSVDEWLQQARPIPCVAPVTRTRESNQESFLDGMI